MRSCFQSGLCQKFCVTNCDVGGIWPDNFTVARLSLALLTARWCTVYSFCFYHRWGDKSWL